MRPSRSGLAVQILAVALAGLAAFTACGSDPGGGGGGTPKGPFCDPPDAGADASVVSGMGASEDNAGHCSSTPFLLKGGVDAGSPCASAFDCKAVCCKCSGESSKSYLATVCKPAGGDAGSICGSPDEACAKSCDYASRCR
jgi:hypothetical protein